MPKTKATRRFYSEQQLNDAVEAAKYRMSVRKASKQFGVPRSTICVKLKGNTPLYPTMGPSTYLTPEEENSVCDWINYIEERGFHITKEQLLDTVQSFIIATKRENPFANIRPGRSWYQSFRKRHPQLITRIAQKLTSTHASVTEVALRTWFSKVREHLSQLNLLDIDPSRVYNCDQTGFRLCPELGDVIVKKGTKSIQTIVKGDKKEFLTSLFMINAAGSMIPPMVLFTHEIVPHNVTEIKPKDWSIGVNDKGWMTAETLYEYVTNVFYHWLKKNNVEFPVILYLDGHSSPINLPLVKFCKSVQIELVALYPNSTHILQPLDVSVFNPMKVAWKNSVLQWRMEHHGLPLRKEDFAVVLKTAIDSLDNLEGSVKNSFKTCGLLPFSADSVNFNVLDKYYKKSHSEITDLRECKKQLKFFEKSIDVGILQKFKSAESSEHWTGSVEYKELFLYWLRMKRKCGEKIAKKKVLLCDEVEHNKSYNTLEVDYEKSMCEEITLSANNSMLNTEFEGSELNLDFINVNQECYMAEEKELVSHCNMALVQSSPYILKINESKYSVGSEIARNNQGKFMYFNIGGMLTSPVLIQKSIDIINGIISPLNQNKTVILEETNCDDNSNSCTIKALTDAYFYHK